MAIFGRQFGGMSFGKQDHPQASQETPRKSQERVESSWQERLRRRINPESLPVFEKGDEIRELLDRAIAGEGKVLIQGETGSGKSVLLPGMVYKKLTEHNKESRVLSIQPRRDAAQMVSKAVAAVEGRKWGRDGFVGFSTSESREVDRDTEISVVTTGIALRHLSKMVEDVIVGRRIREDFGAVIVDEFHENSVEYHMILGMLKILEEHNKAPLTVLTSATLDKEKTLAYEGLTEAEYIAVEGRKFDVEKRFQTEKEPGEKRPSYTKLAAQEAKAALKESDGDVLVFMPGVREINDTIKNIGHIEGVEVLALHGSLDGSEREYVLGNDPKEGQRRVIVSTNIAETSLTLPRITTVVDSCRRRVVRHNPDTGIYERRTEFISKDSAEQRAGRAGRVQEGVCRRLVSESEWGEMNEFIEPEIHMANLSHVILRLKGLHLDPETFPFIDAPDPEKIRLAEEALQELGALDEDGIVTEVGVKMLDMPFFEPPVARMVVEAEKRNCLESSLVLATLAREGNIFYSPSQKELNARQKEQLEARGYSVVMHGQVPIIMYGDTTYNEERSRQVFEAERNEALQHLRNNHKEAHDKFGTGSDWERNLGVFTAAIEKGLLDVSRGAHAPQGREAQNTFYAWCRENYVNAKALQHAAGHVFDYARALKIQVDRETLQEMLQATNRDDMGSVILSGHPKTLLFLASTGRGMPGYAFFGEGTQEVNISPGSAAFHNRPKACIVTHISEGKGTRRGGEIIRNYGHGVHPVTAQQIREVFPHLLAERDGNIRYNKETGNVSRVKEVTPKKNTSLVLEEREESLSLEESYAVIAEKLYNSYDYDIDLSVNEDNKRLLTSMYAQQNRFGPHVQLPDLKEWYAEKLQELNFKYFTQGGIESKADALTLQRKDLFSPDQEAKLARYYPEYINIPGFSQVSVNYRYYDNNHEATLSLPPQSDRSVENFWENNPLNTLEEIHIPRLGTEDDEVNIELSITIPGGIIVRTTEGPEHLRERVDNELTSIAYSSFLRSHSEESIEWEPLENFPERKEAVYYTGRNDAEYIAYGAPYRQESRNYYDGSTTSTFYYKWFVVKEEADAAYEDVMRYKKQADQEEMEKRRIEEEKEALGKVVLVDFGGRYRAGGSNQDIRWVVGPDGKEREPDEWETHYGDRQGQEWYEVRARELALEWMSGSNASAHDFITHHVPEDLTEGQRKWLERRLEKIEEDWKAARGLTSGKRKPSVGRGWIDSSTGKSLTEGFKTTRQMSGEKELVGNAEYDEPYRERPPVLEEKRPSLASLGEMLREQMGLDYKQPSEGVGQGELLKESQLAEDNGIAEDNPFATAFKEAGMVEDRHGDEEFAASESEDIPIKPKPQKKKVESNTPIQEEPLFDQEIESRIYGAPEGEERALTIIEIKQGFEDALGRVLSEIEAIKSQEFKLLSLEKKHKQLRKDRKKIEKEIKSLTERKADKERRPKLTIERSKIIQSMREVEPLMRQMRSEGKNAKELVAQRETLQKQIAELARMEDESLS